MPKAPFLVIALLASTPLAAFAQSPTNPVPQGRGVWQLNFGATKLPKVGEPATTRDGHGKASAHTPGDDVLFQKPVLVRITEGPSAPIDCAMAKPADPALDAKMVHKHQAGQKLSGVIIPVAPCAKK